MEQQPYADELLGAIHARVALREASIDRATMRSIMGAPDQQFAALAAAAKRAGVAREGMPAWIYWHVNERVRGEFKRHERRLAPFVARSCDTHLRRSTLALRGRSRERRPGTKRHRGSRRTSSRAPGGDDPDEPPRRRNPRRYVANSSQYLSAHYRAHTHESRRRSP